MISISILFYFHDVKINNHDVKINNHVVKIVNHDVIIHFVYSIAWF